LPVFSHQLSKIRLVADNPSIPCPADLAQKDRPIHRAAHASKANVLLTGDHRDFGFLFNAPELANGLLIQPVADFLVALGAPAASADKPASSPWPLA
jgi:hypothetical protein